MALFMPISERVPEIKLAKVKIMQLVYKSHLFDCFLKVYRWMQVALKKDIKW